MKILLLYTIYSFTCNFIIYFSVIKPITVCCSFKVLCFKNEFPGSWTLSMREYTICPTPNTICLEALLDIFMIYIKCGDLLCPIHNTVYWFQLGGSILGSFGNFMRWGLLEEFVHCIGMPTQCIPYSSISQKASQQILLFLLIVLLMFLLLWENTKTKSELGRTGFIPTHKSQVTVYHWGRQGKNSSQKPGGRNRRRGHGGVVLSDLVLWLAQPAFLYTTRLAASGWCCP